MARFRFMVMADQGLIPPHDIARDGVGTSSSTPSQVRVELMARIGGLTSHQREGSWTREPFTSDSSTHISVWQKTPKL